MDTQVVDVPEKGRFEIRLDGRVVGLASYHVDGTTMTLPHTEVDPGVGGQGIDQAGHRRIGGDRAEHLRMRPQLGDVGQAVPADGQRHGQIQQHLARVMAGGRPPPRRQGRAQR